MFAHYARMFSIGKSTHRVEIYEEYTEERGLIGEPVITRNSGRIAECLKQLPINEIQIKAIKALARDKDLGKVIHPDGRRTVS